MRKMKDLNVIFITLDGLRQDRLNLMPNFSSISEKGLFFSNMISVSPYTFASIPSVFCGIYPSINGIDSYYSMFRFRKNECKTLSQYFKEAGYYTFADVLNDCILPNIGFDEMKLHTMEDDLIVLHKKILSELPKNRKFFLYLHYTTIHDEYIKLAKKYTDFDKNYFNNYEENKKSYDFCVKQTDEYVKEIVDYIKELGLFEDTLIVFHSDHGTSNGEKVGEKLYGCFTYDYSLKVFSTFLIPGQEGKKINFQCRTLDIMPTILDVMEINPDERFEKLQGKSLLSFVRGEENEDRIVFVETGGLGGPWPSPKKHNVFCVRHRNKKLIYNATPKTFEFYDLEKDPEENFNLIETNNASLGEIIQEYKKILFEKIKENKINLPENEKI